MVKRLYNLVVARAMDGDLLGAKSDLEQQLLDGEGNGNSHDLMLTILNLGAIEAALGHTSRAEELFLSLVQSDRPLASVDHNLQQLRLFRDRYPLPRRSRIAILSFLFNWPSTGGGIIHTVELTKFLQKAGYEVQLIHPVFPEWGIGQVAGSCPVTTTPLSFSLAKWNIPQIQKRFRQAVDRFSPDHIIITDCWNFKPHLAAAVRDYSYFLRMQASECLCPLNNLRLWPGTEGNFHQCLNSQPATPSQCRSCLIENARFSGALHKAERELSEVGTSTYHELLLQSVREATAVLVLNQSTKELWAPYSQDVRVVTWGMDAARFPKIEPLDRSRSFCRLLFAGLPNEPIKGFSVLLEACQQLWQTRQDFELLVTASAEPIPSLPPFVKCIGWQSQMDLPLWYQRADLVVVPAVAQEGLSRTAVEAMASSRPVLGSRIEGLPDILEEGVTGLLAEPGMIQEWAHLLAWMMDHPDERQEMGRQGRQRFEASFTWERVIEEQYAPLLIPHRKTTKTSLQPPSVVTV